MDIDWNLITDNEFEELCGAILSKSGFYNIRNIGGSGDRGRDLVAEKDNQIAFGLKRTEKWIIQCKKWIERKPSPTDLEKSLVWAKAHNPDGVLFFFSNKITPDTFDWVKEYTKDCKFHVDWMDATYIENYLHKDSQIYERFFKEKNQIINQSIDNFYHVITGPRTNKIMVYTAGEMPSEVERHAIHKWRATLQNLCKDDFEIGFYHPEFFGCDHGGINAGETVLMDSVMIEKADVAIAYLNKEELYGTIAELLIAYFLNKMIGIFVDESIIYGTEQISEIDGEPEYLDNAQEIYSKIFKTNHLCSCVLYFDKDILVRTKYWFLLEYLNQVNSQIHIQKVTSENYAEEMSKFLKKCRG